MTRVALLLSLLAACDGAEPAVSGSATARAGETETEAETEAEAESEAEAETEAETAAEPALEEPPYFLAERPDTFFLVDDCHLALGDTAAMALRECRRLARSGGPYQRQACDCRPAMVMEITPQDPIAFYRGCCSGPGDTPAEAHAECRRRVRDGWCRPPDTRRVDAVTGPYDRPGTGRPYEDAEEHRYLARWPSGEHFEWVDERGEAPCFAAGTAIATPAGPVPIERVAAGDRVLTVQDGRVESAPVIAVREREAHRLLAVSFDGGSLHVTVEHPIWVGERWVPARELRVGDRLQTRDGAVVVRSVVLEEGSRTVHSLRVGAPHTYLAGGVLVHNY